MLKFLPFLTVVGLWSTAAAAPAGRTAADREAAAFFEARVRPVLMKHCHECHSLESGKSKGGLRVDTPEALLRGGDSGAAVIPRRGEESLLYQALVSADEDKRMPPDGRLPAAVIADLRRWIDLGAPFPHDTQLTGAEARTAPPGDKSGKPAWSHLPLTKPTPPVADGWARTDLDRFIRAEHLARGLTPNPDADAVTLVRRLYFVLGGIPPSAEEAARWSRRLGPVPGKLDQAAVADLVDMLLGAREYGEHWGRHWLDVVRYAESTGGDRNNITMHAWRYRDYVIDAFNADKPFDRMIREQLASDLLPAPDKARKAEALIATGFLAIGVKNVGDEDAHKFQADMVDEQIDATTRAFLGTSVACARCHDHKSDPVTQADYYAMAAIFRATDTRYGLIKAQSRHTTALLDLTGMGPPPAMPAASKQKLAELTKARDDAARAVEEAMKDIRSGENVFRGKLRRLRSDREETATALDGFGAGGEARVLAMGVQAAATAPVTRLLTRGDLDKPTQVVRPGVPAALGPAGGAFAAGVKAGGRLELADWIASPRNPLTARVMANRVWHWMTGEGLVRTVDDFGATGEPPSHPALLDHLAARLIDHRWSVKALIREIALSRAWQLSSAFGERQFAADPENRLLWRANPRRLEAESLRDAMLATSGKLARDRPLGTLLTEAGEGTVGLNVFEPVIRKLDHDHRSVYLPRVRNVMPEMLDLFDAPDASTVTGARSVTTGPTQALFMLNSPFVEAQAASFAGRIAAQPSAHRVDFAWLTALGRLPDARERAIAAQLLAGQGAAAGKESAAYAPLARALLGAAEFRTLH